MNKKLIEILIFLYLVLFPFGQLTKLPVKISNFPEVNIYLTDLLAGGIGLIGLIGKIGKVRKENRKLTKLMLVFLGITAFSLILNIPSFEKREIFVGGLYWLRLGAYFGLFLIVRDANWFSRSNWKDWLMIIGLVIAIFGLIQYFFWPDLSFLTFWGWDPHYLRLVGTFLDPNFTGILLVLAIILVVNEFKPKINWWIKVGVFWVSLILTYSRASWLALLAGMGTFFWRKKRLKILPIIILLLGITIIFLPKKAPSEGVKLWRTASISSRIGSWRQALEIAKHHFLFGVGFNTYRYAQKKYGFLRGEEWLISRAGAGVDNSFLFILATSGIIGLGIGLGILKEILRLSSKKSPLVFASLIAVVVHSFFNNTLFYPWVMGWLAIILGIM